MLVSERWLTNADRRLRELSAPKGSKRSQGLFYALRPFYQKSSWTQDANGVWNCTAAPLSKDSLGYDVRDRREVNVVAPCSSSTVAPPTTTGQRFWAIQRGSQWEYVVGDNCERLEETTAVVDVDVEETGEAITSVAAHLSARVPTDGATTRAPDPRFTVSKSYSGSNIIGVPIRYGDGRVAMDISRWSFGNLYETFQTQSVETRVYPVSFRRSATRSYIQTDAFLTEISEQTLATAAWLARENEE